jgi:hypothetical protein
MCLLWGRGYGFGMTEFRRAMWKMFGKWLNATYPGKWTGRRGPISWSPRVAGSNSDGCFFFSVGSPEGARLCSSSQDYCRSRGKTLSSCDNVWCYRVKVCTRGRCAALCRLPWNGRRQHRIPIVTTRHPWFHLIACAIWLCHVSWKVNVTRHVLYNIFDLWFINKKSHYGGLVREVDFILYIHFNRSWYHFASLASFLFVSPEMGVDLM